MYVNPSNFVTKFETLINLANDSFLYDKKWIIALFFDSQAKLKKTLILMVRIPDIIKSNDSLILLKHEMLGIVDYKNTQIYWKTILLKENNESKELKI